MSQVIKNYSDSKLQQLFDHDIWQAALVLHKAAAVSGLLFVRDGAIITAQVTGISDEVSSVYIEIDDQHVEGDCSCNQGGNCEHVAAALLEAKQRDSLSRDASVSQRRVTRSNILNSDSPESGSQCVIYVVKLTPLNLGSALRNGQTFSIIPYVSAVGSPGHDFLMTSSVKQLNPARFRNGLYPRYIAAIDKKILTRLSNSQDSKCLMQCLQTGRCYWDLSEVFAEHPFRMPGLIYMRPEPAVVAEMKWQTNPDCTQQAVMHLRDQPLLVLISNPLTCVNINDRCYAEISLPDDFRKFLIDQPAITSDQADRLRAADRWDEALTPHAVQFEQVEADRISARLVLKSVDNCDYAHIFICYDDVEFSYGTVHKLSAELRYVEGNTVYQFSRNHRREQQLLAPIDVLQETGAADDFLIASSSNNWLRFVSATVPELARLDWAIEYEPGFRYQVKKPTSWNIEIDSKNNKETDWFSMSLNIIVDDATINILPSIVSLLNPYLSEDPLQWERSINQGMWSEYILADEIFLPILDTNTYVAVPLSRFKRILDTIVELYDANALDDNGNLPMSYYQISRTLTIVGEHDDHNDGTEWHVPVDIESILTTLQRSDRSFDKVPDSFSGTLRPYQSDGVNWMRMLAGIGFGGILADDMGLGKTVQTLAFLSGCKNGKSGNLGVLIVVPTSLLGNWRQEAARFAPSLKWLTLHGQKRKRWLSKADEYDVVVTTYQTLLVDAEWFLQQKYRTLILDEAQVIRNPNTQIAKVAKKIDSEVRFCLTGTPMENHLGELWSLFDFLMPGLLGNINAFTRHYRVPIEQQNIHERKTALSKRIAPFLLRRTKDAVARELPKKTVIIQRVELYEQQRDLYESIRIAMHKDVLRIFNNNTLHKNRLSILDALLKLRQVCCDPRLLREDLRKGVSQSAKLELLMHLVEELLEEGRSAIIFSQFTSMLRLISDRLDHIGINYDCLTGKSRNREELVDSFQRGSFPLFLVSLKAGGVGLNLTRADTVIHYDPWWNPAVESQATDRAHRIGQDKPVFVYKLIAEMTVEEKILQLQDRKRDLVDNIYKDHENQITNLQGEDLLNLFEPMISTNNSNS